MSASDLSGQCFVVKYGGAAMDDPQRIEAALTEIVGLARVGIRPVIVHGGGKAITRALQKEGVATQFIDGLRVTDAASIAAIERTLDEEVGPGIAGAIARLGGRAVALSGKAVLRARPIVHARAAELGFVGEVEGVALAPIEEIEVGVIPVISPLGAGSDGAVYNINADTAASAVAVALRAARLIFLTDVNGVLRDPADPASTLPTLDPFSIERLQVAGIISGGMIPKVGGAVDALRRGVGRVDFLNGAAGFSFSQPCGTSIYL